MNESGGKCESKRIETLLGVEAAKWSVNNACPMSAYSLVVIGLVLECSAAILSFTTFGELMKFISFPQS